MSRILGLPGHENHFDADDPDVLDGTHSVSRPNESQHPNIPEELRSGREVVEIHLNGKPTYVLSTEIGSQSFQFVAGKPNDALAIVAKNHSSSPILVVAALNGMSVLTGKPASRDDDAILVLPGTTCKIERWFDESPLQLFGVPAGYDTQNVAMGTLGVYTYEVVEKPDPSNLDLSSLAMGGLRAAMSALSQLGSASQTRSGVWKDLRTGSPVPAALFQRKYPAGHQIGLRYDTVEKLAQRGIHVSTGDPTDQVLDSWWANSAFPADDRSYLGGLPKHPNNERKASARERSWQREREPVSV